MNRTRYLDKFLDSRNFDAFLIRDDSSNSNMYYLTEFETSDPFIYLRKNGESIILVPQLEYSRAKEEAEVDKVINSSKFIQGESRDSEHKKILLLEKFLKEFNVENLAVPQDFPFKLARNIEEAGIEIQPVEDKVMQARKIKEKKEVEKIRQVQQYTEESMRKAEKLIREADIKNSKLYLNGEPLTSEKLKKGIKKFLIEKKCDVPQETIVASGKTSAKPHSTGSGPIKEGEPIVIDIFPKHRNKYFGDMTRTFVKEEPSEKVKKMKEAVLEAQKAAFNVLEKGEGVKAKKIHNKVCDILENHGYKTLRDNDTESGFIHSTGHAVGLDLHEPPRIAGNKDELRPGMVLTIEPGLYIPEIGGVRIEDMVLVKEDGYENFNSMSKEIEIE